ncbi:hypothetical protein RHMOL_Rhmol04G0335100 [Rhododendron molle]|uniref:Uncharacterized protein n=1 Tax=Rhododendron molle TaxID=49168 RepID=A0ACC0P9I4_RHOML|nr:hypothetical protein RHMOL_Rhmol04G0335100 [Rhododendron molle]
MTCRYNHPCDRSSVGGAIRTGGGEFPKRLGEPLCQGQKECSYYLKMWQCNFHMTCKFHHPEPGGMSMPSSARPFYPMVQSSSIASNDQYGELLTSYSTARPPLLPDSYLPGAYGHQAENEELLRRNETMVMKIEELTMSNETAAKKIEELCDNNQQLSKTNDELVRSLALSEAKVLKLQLILIFVLVMCVAICFRGFKVVNKGNILFLP